MKILVWILFIRSQWMRWTMDGEEFLLKILPFFPAHKYTVRNCFPIKKNQKY